MSHLGKECRLLGHIFFSSRRMTNAFFKTKKMLFWQLFFQLPEKLLSVHHAAPLLEYWEMAAVCMCHFLLAKIIVQCMVILLLTAAL